MCGSGTTIDVCKEENRNVIGYDIFPTRMDIIQNDSKNNFYLRGFKYLFIMKKQ